MFSSLKFSSKVQKALLRLVYAVLGPPFLLGNPYRGCAGSDGLAYVFGERLGIQVHLPCADAAYDFDHTVGLHQVLYQFVLKQVAAHAQFSERQSGVVHSIEDQGGIQHYVAMV